MFSMSWFRVWDSLTQTSTLGDPVTAVRTRLKADVGFFNGGLLGWVLFWGFCGF